MPRVGFGSADSGDKSSVSNLRIPEMMTTIGYHKKREDTEEMKDFGKQELFFTAIWATIYANGLVSLSKLSRRSVCCAVLGLLVHMASHT